MISDVKEKLKELCLRQLGDSVREGKGSVLYAEPCGDLLTMLARGSYIGGGGTNVHPRLRDIRLSRLHPTNGQPLVFLNAQYNSIPFNLILFHSVDCQEVALIAFLCP